MMKKVCFYLLIILISFSCKDEESEPQAQGETLYELINQYRVQNGLEQIPRSASLEFVAETHLADLINYYTPNEDCNLHTWSENGNWSACCYSADHAEAQCMWNKPAELTSYPGYGYEIAAYRSSRMTPREALELWKNSSAHNNVILSKNEWANPGWKAIGTAIGNGYAVVWFGEIDDPE